MTLNGVVKVNEAELVLAIVTVVVADAPSATEPASSRSSETVKSGGTIALARFCGSSGDRTTKSVLLSPVSCVLPPAPPGLRS